MITGQFASIDDGQLPACLFPGGVDIYGDSLAIGYGTHYTHQGWMHRLATLLGARPNTRGGSVGQFEESWVMVLQDYGAAVKTEQALPYRAWPSGERLVGIGFGFNDLGLGGQGAISPCLSAMRGMISRALTGHILDDKYLDVGGPSGAGDWSLVATTLRNSGDAYRETSVNGAHFTYVTRGVMPGMVYALGGPVFAGTTGFIDITLDGVLHGSVDLSAAAPRAPGYYGAWCYRLNDIPPYGVDGAHAINGTVRDMGNGDKAAIDYCNIEAAWPPVVLVKNVIRPLRDDPGWARTETERDADIAAFNSALKALCGEFEKPGVPNTVLYLDFDSAVNRGDEFFDGSVTESGHLLDDGLHLNDEGFALLTGVAYEALREWRQASFDPVSAARCV